MRALSYSDACFKPQETSCIPGSPFLFSAHSSLGTPCGLIRAWSILAGLRMIIPREICAGRSRPRSCPRLKAYHFHGMSSILRLHWALDVGLDPGRFSHEKDQIQLKPEVGAEFLDFLIPLISIPRNWTKSRVQDWRLGTQTHLWGLRNYNHFGLHQPITYGVNPTKDSQVCQACQSHGPGTAFALSTMDGEG